VKKETFYFGNYNVRQLRKVAGSLGVRNASRMLKDTILITIGQLKQIGERLYDTTASSQPEKAVIQKKTTYNCRQQTL
jgi:hypothetical protein